MNESTPLDTVAQRYVSNGWKITTIDSQRFTATKKKSPNGLAVVLGIIGLLFYIVPGLLILLLAYVARGEETVVFTAAQAEELIEEERRTGGVREAEAAKREADREDHDRELKAQAERNIAEQARRIAQIKDGLRRTWAFIRGRSGPV